MNDKKSISGADRDAGHRIIVGTTREGMVRPFQESAPKHGHSMSFGDARVGKTKLATILVESFVKRQ